MRPFALASVVLMTLASGIHTRAGADGGLSAPIPLIQSQRAAAAPSSGKSTQGSTRISGDEGVVCATAIKGPVDTMPAVIKACGKIQAKQPTAGDRARVLRYRGVALKRSGDLPAAIADFDQVLRLTPEDTWALQGRAEAHEALGHKPQAIDDYLRLEALGPDTRWRVRIAQLGANPPPPPPPSVPATPAPAEPQIAVAPATPPAPVPQAAAAAPEPVPDADDPAVLIRKIQAALRALGYDVGAVNGRLGAKTRQAVDAFAADVGLPTDGQPDQELLAAAEDELDHRRQLAAVDQLERNRRIQKGLADLGYYTGDIDGALGPQSRRALERWLAESGRPASLPINDALAQALDASVVAELSTARPEASDPAVAPRPPVATAPDTDDPPLVKLSTPSEPFTPPAETQVVVVAPSEPLVEAEPPGQPPPTATRSTGPYDILPPAAEMPEKRVALVIGNGEYAAVTPLANPRNDADDVSTALSELGFEVMRGIDLSRESMSRITKDFARRARTADIAMAYYSGHGMQFESTNYLVPVDVQIQDEYDLREMVQLSQVIQDTGQAKKLALVVVDACRDDPLAKRVLAQSLGASRSTSLGSGLAAPRLPTSQSLIAYATAADFVAYDGDVNARNSPFTAALLKNIKTQKLDVRQLFGKISDEVRKATSNKQRPDMWAALGGDPIYLVPGPPDPVGLDLAEFTEGEVLLIQRSLKWLKLWTGAEDGIVTPEVTRAVREWQRWQASEQSGRLTPQQVVGLYRFAARDRPPASLPDVKIEVMMAKIPRGDVEAQRTMGMLYDPAFADGPPLFAKDRGTAQNWYAQAAMQGDHVAAALLGTLLVAPDNPNPNLEEATLWLEKAAQGDNPNAALRIAELLLERQVDDASRAKAVRYLQVAAIAPDTSGMARVLLRQVGQPVAR